MNEDVMNEAGDDDFDVGAVLSGPLMKKVLQEVAHERQKQDGALGLFRDYPDGTAGRAISGPTISRDMDAEREAKRKQQEAEKTGRITWRHGIDTAHAEVVSCGSDIRLRAKLITLAALSVSWVEAIDRRKDERRIERKTQPSTLWHRFVRWFVQRFYPRPF